MDEVVARSLAKWPDVPAVYGWLALDARGNWLLRNPATREFERVGNAGLRQFIARNYEHDARGGWFFQNGPQRVYVRLEYTPLVFRLCGDVVFDHCGRRAGELNGAWLDERGALIVLAAAGVGVIEDRELLAASELLVDASGATAGGLTGAEFFVCSSGRTPLGRIARAELPARFNFTPDPKP